MVWQLPIAGTVWYVTGSIMLDYADHSPRILDALPGTRIDIVPDRAYLASLGLAHENGRVTAAGRAAIEDYEDRV